MINEYGTISGMRIDRGKGSTSIKSGPSAHMFNRINHKTYFGIEPGLLTRETAE